MNGIQNIIFDLGGVILPIELARTTEAYRQLGMENIDQLFGHGHADSFFEDYEEGRIGDDVFIGEIRKRLRVQVPEQQITDAWNALLLEFPPERIELIRSLRDRYRLFLFSNTNGIHHASFTQQYRTRWEGKEFDDLFEQAWYSHLIGRRKPDLAAFRYVIEQGNIDPGATIFVDDSKNNVDGAKAAGLKGLYLEPGSTILDFAW